MILCRGIRVRNPGIDPRALGTQTRGHMISRSRDHERNISLWYHMCPGDEDIKAQYGAFRSGSERECNCSRDRKTDRTSLLWKLKGMLP